MAMNSILARVKPKDYSRFMILCESCLEHDDEEFSLDKVSAYAEDEFLELMKNAADEGVDKG